MSNFSIMLVAKARVFYDSLPTTKRYVQEILPKLEGAKLGLNLEGAKGLMSQQRYFQLVLINICMQGGLLTLLVNPMDGDLKGYCSGRWTLTFHTPFS